MEMLLARPRRAAVCSSGSQLPVPHLPLQAGGIQRKRPERDGCHSRQTGGRVTRRAQLMDSGYRLFSDDAHKAILRALCG